MRLKTKAYIYSDIIVYGKQFTEFIVQQTAYISCESTSFSHYKNGGLTRNREIGGLHCHEVRPTERNA